MKRLFAILLSMLMAVMMMFSFTGCDFNLVDEESTTEDTTFVEEITSDGIGFNKNIVVETDDFGFYVDGVEVNKTEKTWSVKVFMDNKTDKILTFNWKEVLINDCAVDPDWTSEVAGATREPGTVIFPMALLAEHDITEVENLKFTLSVVDEKGNVIDDTEYVFSLTVSDEDITALN